MNETSVRSLLGKDTKIWGEILEKNEIETT